MGAGKTTIGREVARLTERPFVDLDEEIEACHGPIARLFDERGEAEFRRLEEEVAHEALASARPAVIALGGGAVTSSSTRERLREHAFTVWLPVDPDLAWDRARSTDRPLARNRRKFWRLFDERVHVYAEVSDDSALDVDEVLQSSLGVAVSLDCLSPPRRHEPAAVIADAAVLELHHMELFSRVISRHPITAGEQTKQVGVVARLWDEIELDRAGTIVAFGGGSVTDVAGFVAATYLRGMRWVAIPTTLVGQVDAAIGGKTAINVPKGKNLAGAFHYPEEVVIDTDLLSTLPESEKRAGMAEIVKTGLLAGRPLWDLPTHEMVSGAAAFKAAVCLSDPYETAGRREVLNLGHTFAHALEAASDYTLSHGDAVALGLLGALRLSGLDTGVVAEVLRPKPVRVDRERAWAALRRDKKARDGRIRLVLLERPGKPVFPVELPEREVRAALTSLVED